jgi:hypothetical protein
VLGQSVTPASLWLSADRAGHSGHSRFGVDVSGNVYKALTEVGEMGTRGQRRTSRRIESTWVSYTDAARLFLRGVTLPTAIRVALLVGTWLSLMNQGQLIVHGHPPWVKLALNYLTPFAVASIGFLAARRRRNVERLVTLLREPPG